MTFLSYVLYFTHKNYTKLLISVFIPLLSPTSLVASTRLFKPVLIFTFDIINFIFLLSYLPNFLTTSTLLLII